jgi:hypothetical protein
VTRGGASSNASGSIFSPPFSQAGCIEKTGGDQAEQELARQQALPEAHRRRSSGTGALCFCKSCLHPATDAILAEIARARVGTLLARANYSRVING